MAWALPPSGSQTASDVLDDATGRNLYATAMDRTEVTWAR